MLWASCANSASSPKPPSPSPLQTSHCSSNASVLAPHVGPAFRGGPLFAQLACLVRSLHGAGSSFLSLRAVIPPALSEGGWPTDSRGNDLGCRTLVGFTGAGFDFSLVPSGLLPTDFRSQPSHSFERLVADPKLVELPQEWP